MIVASKLAVLKEEFPGLKLVLEVEIPADQWSPYWSDWGNIAVRRADLALLEAEGSTPVGSGGRGMRVFYAVTPGPTLVRGQQLDIYRPVPFHLFHTSTWLRKRVQAEPVKDLIIRAGSALYLVELSSIGFPRSIIIHKPPKGISLHDLAVNQDTIAYDEVMREIAEVDKPLGDPVRTKEQFFSLIAGWDVLGRTGKIYQVDFATSETEGIPDEKRHVVLLAEDGHRVNLTWDDLLGVVDEEGRLFSLQILS